jgi:alpha-beta hydrolase superfamily lysophospholipase
VLEAAASRPGKNHRADDHHARELDGIAGFGDLIEFSKRLPNPDKQFAVMAGIAHASFQQKNYRSVYRILRAFFTQPEPVYRG